MKRILLALSVLIFSNGVFAQNAEKGEKFDKNATYAEAKIEQKNAVNEKYEQLTSLLEKKDYTAAKQKYAEAQSLMEQSLASDKRFLKNAKSEEEKAQMERRLDSKTRLYEQSKSFLTADLAKEGKRFAVYIKEFAFVTEKY